MIATVLYNMEEEFELVHQDGWGKIFTLRARECVSIGPVIMVRFC